MPERTITPPHPCASASLDDIMSDIGQLIDDTPVAWARVAMECLDQGMLPLSVQDEITATLRRAGIDLGQG